MYLYIIKKSTALLRPENGPGPKLGVDTPFTLRYWSENAMLESVCNFLVIHKFRRQENYPPGN